jgi:hypothetical protein
LITFFCKYILVGFLVIHILTWLSMVNKKALGISVNSLIALES